MALELKNFNITNFVKDEEKCYKIVDDVVHNCDRALRGYSGSLSFNKKIGDCEFWANIIKENNSNNVDAFNIHAINNIVWDVYYYDIDLNNIDDKTVFKAMFANNEGYGFIPINIINYDMIPSLLKCDKVTLQISATPFLISYYKNTKEYNKWFKEEKCPSPQIGKLFPIHFMNNHNINNKKRTDKTVQSDLYVTFSGKVKRIEERNSIFNGKKKTFINSIIDTNYGELELSHTINQVKKEQRELIKKGSIVSGVCVLTGDAAIDDYDLGAIYDDYNLLKCYRHYCLTGDNTKTKYLFSDDVVYKSVLGKHNVVGKDNVKNHIENIHKLLVENNKNTYVYLGKVLESLRTDEGREPFPIEKGMDCLIIAYYEPFLFDSILLIETNDNHEITKIYLDDARKYKFSINQEYSLDTQYSFFENIISPTNVFEAMSNRTKYYNIIKDDSERISSVENININTNSIIDEEFIKNYCNNQFNYNEIGPLFRYLFVTSSINAYYNTKNNEDNSLIINLNESLEDIIKNNPTINEEIIKQTYNFGSTFINELYDYYNVLIKNNDESLNKILSDICKAIIYFGQLNSRFILENNE